MPGILLRKEWSRRDRNHAPDISHLDWPLPPTPALDTRRPACANRPGRTIRPGNPRHRHSRQHPAATARPEPLRHVAALRGRGAVRPGRGRRGGELHRPVPDGQRDPPPARHRSPGSRHSRRRRPGLRLPRHRAGPARPPRAPGPGAEPGLGRRQRVHERHRRRAGLAEPGHLGHAAGRLRPGQRHLDRRRPRLGPGPPPAAGRRRRRRGGHPAGRARRPDLVAAAPGPGPGLHPGRVPRLGTRGMPGRPRPPRRPPRPAACSGPPGPGPGDGPAEGDQDRPVPFFGHRTVRPSRLHSP